MFLETCTRLVMASAVLSISESQILVYCQKGLRVLDLRWSKASWVIPCPLFQTSSTSTVWFYFQVVFLFYFQILVEPIPKFCWGNQEVHENPIVLFEFCLNYFMIEVFFTHEQKYFSMKTKIKWRKAKIYVK